MKTLLQVFLNAAIGMELEFHANFLFYFFKILIGHNSILNQAIFSLKLNFEIIEFQNRGTDLYSFKIEVYCQIFLKIGVKGQNLLGSHYSFMQMFVCLFVCFFFFFYCEFYLIYFFLATYFLQKKQSKFFFYIAFINGT